ncbi:MAG: PD-(D/E)XK nuclease family protein, partial [Rhodospirillales bacterium]|nr:PD-(D/E)XK nuclease family protein [Rhodospirillales bacterium]
GLKVLDPIDADPGAADRGTIVHDALEVFLRDHLDHLPDDAEARLIEVGRQAFGDHLTRPGVRAFWWPRFKRIAHWFIADERARRNGGALPVAVESAGEIEFNAPGGVFRLSAKADRIDRLGGGGLAIIDYKTGVAATAPQAETGLEPQLPLEAAMAERGMFTDVAADEVRALTYIRLSGGRVPGEVKTLKLDAHEVAENAWAGLQQLISEYDHPDKPYHSHLRPMRARETGDYDHLARVREWLSEDDEP